MVTVARTLTCIICVKPYEEDDPYFCETAAVCDDCVADILESKEDAPGD
jgi:hypothetical protein